MQPTNMPNLETPSLCWWMLIGPRLWPGQATPFTKRLIDRVTVECEAVWWSHILYIALEPVGCWWKGTLMTGWSLLWGCCSPLDTLQKRAPGAKPTLYWDGLEQTLIPPGEKQNSFIQLVHSVPKYISICYCMSKSYQLRTGWWFGTFFIFPYIRNNHPNWLIFFRRVEKPPTR